MAADAVRLATLAPDEALGMEPGAETVIAPIAPVVARRRPFRGWYWLLAPLLAVVAYGPVLGVGLLSDDYVLLTQARLRGWNFQDILLPSPGWSLYRPVGTALTWQVGWQVWGLDPLPYHVISLLAHAGVALALGLWLAQITEKPALGLLAGSLFAAFPLHTEAVGWIAAQWDVLAALFGLWSLLLYTMWWRAPHKWHLYVLSLPLYALGIFTKESIFLLLPIFALSDWFVSRKFTRQIVGRLLLSLAPFGLILGLNLGLRLAAWGRIGGYQGARVDYGNFAWDASIEYAHVLLSPINAAALGQGIAQVVGALTSLALLVGLVVYGRRYARLLLLAGAWVVLALAPTLNLLPSTSDLQQNRFLYLASAGYVVGVSTLLYATLLRAGRWRTPALACVGILTLLSVVVCWLHLQPWQSATAQTLEIEQSLSRMIPPPAQPVPDWKVWHMEREIRGLAPPDPQPEGVVWYVENMPDTYQGAYLYRLGLRESRFLRRGEMPWVEQVPGGAEESPARSRHDAFALRFGYDAGQSRFSVERAAGITRDGEPPAEASLSKASTWDFRDCAPGVIGMWGVVGAKASCRQGKGLLIQPEGDDPQMVSPAMGVAVEGSGAEYVRLRVSARYPLAGGGDAPVPTLQWYWQGDGQAFGGERYRSMAVKKDGEQHIYWTFIRASEVGQVLERLRFDPTSGTLPVEVGWIAADLVTSDE